MKSLVENFCRNQCAEGDNTYKIQKLTEEKTNYEAKLNAEKAAKESVEASMKEGDDMDALVNIVLKSRSWMR